jgi:hypothetical protein
MKGVLQSLQGSELLLHHQDLGAPMSTGSTPPASTFHTGKAFDIFQAFLGRGDAPSNSGTVNEESND